jgi:hypothetical protein
MFEMHVYYRCRGCGKLEAPVQIDPTDDTPPVFVECACWSGPDWERGYWVSSPLSVEEDA